jgi:tyrosine-protein phosphatase YwqE
MFSFFTSSKTTPDLSFIGVDMHSHLLPGIDDGLKTPEETMQFMEELHIMGYKKFICTPHILSGVHPNTPESILPKLALIQDMLKKSGLPVDVEAGAEYMVDLEMEALVNNNDRLMTFGDNYILIEMSYLAASPNIEQVIFQLRMKGIKPILAHPERYTFHHRNFSAYERYQDLGCLLQLNLLSLLGYYGEPIKEVAEKLVEKKMISLLGTDMHHATHLKALKDLSSKKSFYKKIAGLEIKNLELFGA